MAISFPGKLYTRLWKYKILNTIVPYFEETRYPYDTLTEDKITFTQKEIELTYIKDDKFFVTSDQSKHKKGGFEKINIYLYDADNSILS